MARAKHSVATEDATQCPGLALRVVVYLQRSSASANKPRKERKVNKLECGAGRAGQGSVRWSDVHTQGAATTLVTSQCRQLT